MEKIKTDYSKHRLSYSDNTRDYTWCSVCKAHYPVVDGFHIPKEDKDLIIKNLKKEKILRSTFALLTNGYIPDEVFSEYMDGDFEKIQCWCVNNMRGELMDWCTGIGIIEAVELMYNVAIENGNIK